VAQQGALAATAAAHDDENLTVLELKIHVDQNFARTEASVQATDFQRVGRFSFRFAHAK
jgi:hypothetical protein